MDSTTEEMLAKSFAEAAGEMTHAAESLTSAAKERPAGSTIAESLTPESTPATSSAGSGTGSKLLSIATTALESGMGVVPLVAGLIGLFGGGDDPAPPALVKYAMPEKMAFQAMNTESGVGQMDYDQTGMPRAYFRSPDTPAAGGGSGSTEGTAGAAAGPQIQINVQALDSRSFLDHSSEIAQAVRSAMLNLSSINDVVSDL